MYDILLLQMSLEGHWIKNLQYSFLSDLYFSRYFGSHIMGFIYLFVLLYLLIISKIFFFKNENKNFLLIIILFFSYVMPVIYGIISKPVLTDRYIIYVLIPIFILISNLVFNLKDNKKKFFIISIIIISTLVNNYSEIFKRKITKPEFKLTLEKILTSNINNISIKSPRPIIEKIVKNYLESIQINNKNDISFHSVEYNLTKNDKFWLLCYEPVNSFKCDLIHNNGDSWKSLKKNNFHLVESTLYQK